ncbi:XrtA/PEP-CTERM system amidotransferase [Immundisolibacter sp.]|uniref:XrtA/PEP-CTERM system amidotransferase n=1 Tax=Immundisolibacter sp. TaxID=1934948 RepID=UPI003566B697
MCGLVGIFDTRGERPIDRALLDRMNERQHHRGPDEGGLHLEPGLGLGHRRLSIIDLATGQQPMTSADDNLVLVYNGEIYNFAELADELRALGYRFRTHCDTEVILYAYAAWGEACVNHFRGMFAFALWDRPRRQLLLARDRLGIKPLYYAPLADGTLLFGSELKALTTCPQLPRQIDPLAVEDYFGFGYVPEPRTIYKAALKLPPGHTLTVRRGEPVPAPRQFWDLPLDPRPVSADVGAELIERLREAVRIRMIAEVPLGAFLSGGVDSSAVVAMMAGLSGAPVDTCSMAFGEAAYDESAYANDIAQRYGTRHHSERVDADDFDLLDTLADIYDEPFADSSAIPTYRVCQLARRHVTVALSGDGGDESFGGYRRYRWHLQEEHLRRRLPLAVRRPLFGALGRLYPKANWAPRFLRAKATFQSLARDSLEGYFDSVAVIGDDLRASLYSAAFRRDLQDYRAIEVLRRHDRLSDANDPLRRVQYLDFKTYLPGDILTKVDRASMAHALEVRVPILDHPFVEWAAGLPSALKVSGGEGKAVFKQALENHLPRDVLYRPKMGFAVPIDRWFRGPLRERVRGAVLGEHLAGSGLFDMDRLARLVDEHQSGRRDHGTPLWTLLMFEAFLRRSEAAGA